MAYTDKIDQLIRKPINVIEIDLDAKIAPSGVEYHSDASVPLGQNFWPTVTKINWTPTEMIQARGLGYRGVVRVTFQDFDYGDNGTYFGKLIANNDFYLDRKLKLHIGFLNDDNSFDWANTKERLYFIKQIDGPDEKGKVVITAKDPLTQLDRDQALVPKKSNGTLANSLGAGAAPTINIGDNSGFSATGGVAIIDSEIVTYSATVGDDSINLSGRAAYGSEDKTHDAGAPVRECYAFTDQNCVDVIRDLIENFTQIDHANYINDSDWNSERDDYLASEDITGVIKEPTAVKNIIEKITSQTWIDLWWDDEAQSIKLKSIGPTLTPSSSINTSKNVLSKGHKIKRNAESAITQVWYYYDKRDHSKGDGPDNFKSIYITASSELESAQGHGREKIKKIYAPFIPASGNGTASKVCSRILSQEGSGKKEIQLRLDTKDSIIATGDIVDLTSDLSQDLNGNPKTINCRVVSKSQIDSSTYQYKMVATGVDPASRYASIGPNSLLDYGNEGDVNKDKYGFISDDTPEMLNGDPPYIIL